MNNLSKSWEWRKLGDILKLNYGKGLLERERKGGDVPVYGSNGIVGYHDKPHINQDTIVIGRKGSVGTAHLALGESWPIDTTYYVELKTDISLYYVYRLLRYLKLGNIGTSTAIPGLNRNDVYKVEVPIPPLPLQTQIVAILEKAERLKEKREQANQETNKIIQSVFYEMFGDPIRNEKNWNCKKVSEIAIVVRGSSPRPKGDPRYYGGHIPRLMIQDITRDGRLVTPMIDFLTDEGAKLSRPVPEGTVVMTVSSDVGVVACLAVDACIHDGFIAFKELQQAHVNPTYFEFYLRAIKYTHDKRKVGAIFQNLTTTQVKDIIISLPPIELQNEFASIVEKVESLKERQRHSTQEINILFDALLQKAFNGELVV